MGKLTYANINNYYINIKKKNKMKELKSFIMQGLNVTNENKAESNIIGYLSNIMTSSARGEQHTVKELYDNLYVIDDVIYSKATGPGSKVFAFKLTEPLPDYVIFDKKSCKNLEFALDYNNISQDQLNRLPGSIISINSNKISGLKITGDDKIDITQVKSLNKIKIKGLFGGKSTVSLIFDKILINDIYNISSQCEIILRINDQKSYDNLINMMMNDDKLYSHIHDKLRCVEISCQKSPTAYLWVDHRLGIPGGWYQGQEWREVPAKKSIFNNWFKNN